MIQYIEILGQAGVNPGSGGLCLISFHFIVLRNFGIFRVESEPWSSGRCFVVFDLPEISGTVGVLGEIAGGEAGFYLTVG